MWPMLGAAAMYGVGMGMQAQGQASANQTNLQATQMTNVANAEQAALNRDFQQKAVNQQIQWQDYWSNTAYQRSMKDMKMAGLNPMLAYMKGGASTPAAASASGSQAHMVAPRVENTMAGMANSAIQAGQAIQQMYKTQSDIALQNTQAKSNLEAANKAAIEAKWAADRNKREEHLFPSAKSKADFEMKQMKEYGDFDKTLDRINRGVETLGNTLDTINPLKYLKGKTGGGRRGDIIIRP